MIPATEYTLEEFSKRFPEPEIKIITTEITGKRGEKLITTHHNPDLAMNNVPLAATSFLVFEMADLKKHNPGGVRRWVPYTDPPMPLNFV